MTILLVCKEVQLTIFICHIEFSFLLIIIFIPISLFGASNRFFVDVGSLLSTLERWNDLFYDFIYTSNLLLLCSLCDGSQTSEIDLSWIAGRFLRKFFHEKWQFVFGESFASLQFPPEPKYRQTCIHFTNIHTHYYTTNFHNFCLL